MNQILPGLLGDQRCLGADIMICQDGARRAAFPLTRRIEVGIGGVT